MSPPVADRADPSPRPVVIFPITSGRSRETFRPFETVAGELIVHRALRTFDAHREALGPVRFVYTREDEERFAVEATLRRLLPDTNFQTIVLDARTGGPAATVARGVEQAGLRGPAIVCDIDHRLDLQPLFDQLRREPSGPDLVCVWPLAGESLKRWSVACVDRSQLIRDVAERSLPTGSGDFLGVIGCYHFRDIAEVAQTCLRQGLTRYSALLNVRVREGEPVRAVLLSGAEFFGDADRIRAIEEGPPEYAGTIFCDIDGTIFEHEDTPSYAAPPSVLPGSREKLAGWVEQGYYVVLCTARATADDALLSRALADLSIPHHRLVTGLPSGPRVLINDRKPSAIFTTQAHSIEIGRNQGIDQVELPSAGRLAVLKRFEGGSFAETLLMQGDAGPFVRKRATKHHHLGVGYSRLRAQYRTLERFAQMCPGAIPALRGEEDNTHEYFYDMEYLDGFVQMNHCSSEVAATALAALLDQFNDTVYSHQRRRPGASVEWFQTHLDEKIYAKIDSVADNERLRPLIFGSGVEIDGVFHPSLEALLLELTQPAAIGRFAPEFLSVVHGDLTFQNVMVGPDGGVKAIDMESSGAPEGVELDLGKLLQSVISRYDDWHLSETELCRNESPGALSLLFTPEPPDPTLLGPIRDRWAELLGCSHEQVDFKGRLYLGLHLFRMVPFRLRESEDQALYALATAVQQISAALAMSRQ